MFHRHRLRLVLVTLALSCMTGVASAEKITVFAAASLKNALDAVAADWTRQNPKSPIIVSYAASSALAKQIEQGAPADIFFSADQDWMDYLAKAELIKPENRVNVVGNTLVLVSGLEFNGTVDFMAHPDLVALLKGEHLALANVDTVPAGKYAKAALQKLGLWESTEANVAQAENVRAALALVARGEAPFGIVYASDAVAEKSVRVAGVIPAVSHPPITYPAAVVEASSNGEAPRFVSYLVGVEAQATFTSFGFTAKE